MKGRGGCQTFYSCPDAWLNLSRNCNRPCQFKQKHAREEFGSHLKASRAPLLDGRGCDLNFFLRILKTKNRMNCSSISDFWLLVMLLLRESVQRGSLPRGGPDTSSVQTVWSYLHAISKLLLIYMQFHVLTEGSAHCLSSVVHTVNIDIRP